MPPRTRRTRRQFQPPTDCQRWELSASSYQAQAGEDIRYLPRRALALGLPLERDWWLLDDTRLIVMEFSPTREVDSRTLSTDPDVIARHRQWRDLATRNAAPAERFTTA